MANRKTIWFIGEARDRELRFCLRELESLAADFDVRHFATVEEMPAADVRRTSPDILVVLQDWPQQYRLSAIHKVIAHSMPGGRLLCVYGTWCESEGRNSPNLWPHAARIAARNAAERFERELSAIRTQEPTLPLTAARDERFEYNHTAIPADTAVNSVHVISSDRRLRETLTARLAANGIAPSRSTTADVTIAVPDPGETITGAIPVRTMSTGDARRVVPMLVTERQLLATVAGK